MIKIRTGLKAGKLVSQAVEKFCQVTGLAKCADKYTQQTGKDCGCDKRKQILDQVFPF
jgi:hypothetical protein